MARRIVSGKLPVVGYQLSVRQTGFTYLGLLFAVAILGATLAVTGIVWHTAQKRGKERELLFVGNQFRQAIAAYYTRSPGTVKQYPKSLDELLKDPRQLTTQRYLRRLYLDPITGGAEWGLVKNRDERIMGVYSLSEDEPVKQGNFREADKEFEGKAHYSEWRFVYVPSQASPQAIGTAPAPGGAPATGMPQPLTLSKVVEPKPAPSPNPIQLPAPGQPEADAESPPPDESKCDTLLKNDAAVCQIAASKHEEETGKLCAESAEERFAQCRLKQSTIDLPPLKIQAEQEQQ